MFKHNASSQLSPSRTKLEYYRSVGKDLNVKEEFYGRKQAQTTYNARLDYFKKSSYVQYPYRKFSCMRKVLFYMRENNNEDKLLVFLYVDDLNFRGTNTLMFED